MMARRTFTETTILLKRKNPAFFLTNEEECVLKEAGVSKWEGKVKSVLKGGHMKDNERV